MLRPLSIPRILGSGLLAAVAAATANGLLRALALRYMNIDPGFLPLQSTSAISFTLIGGVAATLVLVVLSRASERPLERFARISMIVLMVSLIPDFALLIVNNGYAGTNAASVGTLMLMHFVAAGLIVGISLWGITRDNPFHTHDARVTHQG